MTRVNLWPWENNKTPPIQAANEENKQSPKQISLGVKHLNLQSEVYVNIGLHARRKFMDNFIIHQSFLSLQLLEKCVIFGKGKLPRLIEWKCDIVEGCSVIELAIVPFTDE